MKLTSGIFLGCAVAAYLNVPAAARRERPGSAALMKLPLGREQSGSIRLSRLTRADMSSKESRQNWARLIQKIYEVDPLLCPKCQGTMKIIAFIEEFDIIEKILRHLGLWDIRNHDPPQKVSDYILELVCEKADPRIPVFESWY
jgi:hypothetical protein